MVATQQWCDGTGVTTPRAKEDPMPSTLTDTSRELAHRSANGIDVRLLWGPADGAITVEVDDAAGASFVIDVAPEHALDAFTHPYAYALIGRARELLVLA
jgi:hypothetical protein